MGDDLLPESRARITRGAVQTADGWYIPVYCANCGKPWGMVPEKHVTFAFVLCQSCYDKHGAPAHLYMEPDQVFWNRMRGEMLEQEIEHLTAQELIAHYGDPSSRIGTLLRERYAQLLKTC